MQNEGVPQQCLCGEDLGVLKWYEGIWKEKESRAEAAGLPHHFTDPQLCLQRLFQLSWPWGLHRVCWRPTLSPVAFGVRPCHEQSV